MGKLRNVASLNTFPGNSDRLEKFHLWECCCKVENNSSLERENWAAPTQNGGSLLFSALSGSWEGRAYQDESSTYLAGTGNRQFCQHF